MFRSQFMEELERLVNEKDALIQFLNDERLRQSRIIATQSEIIGRRNRSIDQLHHMRRVSVAASNAPSSATSDNRLLVCVSKAIERLGAQKQATVSCLQLVTLALSYVSGQSVQVKQRRRRSVPSSAIENYSPFGSPVFSAHSDGEEPTGGFDLELIYHTPGKIELPVLVEPLRLPRPLFADLSPRADCPWSELVIGAYNTPLGLTEIASSSSGHLSGRWGAQTATYTVLSAGDISASLEISGIQIQGVRDTTSGSIRWNGGQLWTRADRGAAVRSPELAGTWSWGSQPFIELTREDDAKSMGFWGAQRVTLNRSRFDVDAVLLELENGISMRGMLNEAGTRIKWNNGQLWERVHTTADSIQRIRSS